jgi:hypothetical protein
LGGYSSLDQGRFHTSSRYLSLAFLLQASALLPEEISVMSPQSSSSGEKKQSGNFFTRLFNLGRSSSEHAEKYSNPKYSTTDLKTKHTKARERVAFHVGKGWLDVATMAVDHTGTGAATKAKQNVVHMVYEVGKETNDAGGTYSSVCQGTKSNKRASGTDRALTNRGVKDRQSADLYANVGKGVQHSATSTIRTTVKVGQAKGYRHSNQYRLSVRLHSIKCVLTLQANNITKDPSIIDSSSRLL